jgi:squalene-associated FAD-dependent desaturase
MGVLTLELVGKIIAKRYATIKTMSNQLGPLAASQSDCAKDDTLTPAELQPVVEKHSDRASKSVAIVGGGLAGMAAAAILSKHGFCIDLFEQSNHLGGRACSMEEPWNGQTLDQCQHVAMGCCGSFIDFCRRTGVEDCFQRHKTLHFIGPDGAQSDLSASWWLPAPYHLLPGLFRLKFLTWRECCEIIRALKIISCLRIYKESEIEIFRAWLRRQGQSEKLIEKFWSVVLNSALSETVNFTSLAAVKKVFADGFFSSRHAYELIIPRVPLGEIFDRRASSWLELQGVRIYRGVRVIEISCQDKGDSAIFLYDGTIKNYPAVIVAVPWFEAPYLFSSSPANLPLKLDSLKQIPSAAITAVHLWFDMPIADLPHAAFVGRLSQWIFNGKALDTEHAHDERGHGTPDKTHYYQVVISAAHRVVKHNKEELLNAVLADLQSVFPQAREAELLHARIVDMPRAVFSMQPGIDRLRPPQNTAIANLFFAGDWTATGWPGTMEGAVKSGYLAAKALLEYFRSPVH